MRPNGCLRGGRAAGARRRPGPPRPGAGPSQDGLHGQHAPWSRRGAQPPCLDVRVSAALRCPHSASEARLRGLGCCQGPTRTLARAAPRRASVNPGLWIPAPARRFGPRTEDRVGLDCGPRRLWRRRYSLLLPFLPSIAYMNPELADDQAHWFVDMIKIKSYVVIAFCYRKANYLRKCLKSYLRKCRYLHLPT